MGLSLIFFIVVALSIYFLTNYYIFIHIVPLCHTPAGKAVAVLLILHMIAYPCGRILQAIVSTEALVKISAALTAIGSYYLAFMVYAFFLALLEDIYQFLASLFSFLPLLDSASKAALWKLGICIIIVIVTLGSINAKRPRVVNLDMDMPCSCTSPRSIRAVAVSDMHVGPFMRNSRIRELVDRINSLSPDLVFFVGDIVDESVSTAIEEGLADELKDIKAPLGVYASPGNHDHYAGIDAVEKVLKQAGVKMLRDEFTVVGDAFLLVGREDAMASRFDGSTRKPLSSILKSAPKDRPIVVLDHTPVGLDEATSLNVTLQLSGHTHNGQIWPFNLITGLVFEKSWGILRKGNTVFYVSCGYGTWGPPVRLGSVPEIILLNLKLDPKVEPIAE